VHWRIGTTLIDHARCGDSLHAFSVAGDDLFDRDDCLGGQPIGKIIVDHCSTSWAFGRNFRCTRHVYHPKGTTEYLKYPTLTPDHSVVHFERSVDTYNHAFGGTWGGYQYEFSSQLSPAIRRTQHRMSYDFNFVNNVCSTGGIGRWTAATRAAK